MISPHFFKYLFETALNAGLFECTDAHGGMEFFFVNGKSVLVYRSAKVESVFFFCYPFYHHNFLCLEFRTVKMASKFLPYFWAYISSMSSILHFF